jgi:hypothetical protein
MLMKKKTKKLKVYLLLKVLFLLLFLLLLLLLFLCLIPLPFQNQNHLLKGLSITMAKSFSNKTQTNIQLNIVLSKTNNIFNNTRLNQPVTETKILSKHHLGGQEEIQVINKDSGLDNRSKKDNHKRTKEDQTNLVLFDLLSLESLWSLTDQDIQKIKQRSQEYKVIKQDLWEDPGMEEERNQSISRLLSQREKGCFCFSMSTILCLTPLDSF